MSLYQVQSLAAHTLAAVASGKNLADELAHIIAQNPELTAQDKGMLQDIAYGCQRHLGSLKFMLGKMLNKPIDNEALQRYLLVALYQLNHTQNAPHAVVNEAVNHIAQIGRGQFRSFANAILRRFLREKDGLNKACRYDDVAKHNLPIWLQKNLQNQYPKHWHNIATAFQAHPPLTLRVNRRHANAEQYLAMLHDAGLNGKILDDYAIRLSQAVPVAQLPRFADGWVSVQDWGAQQAAPLLAPQNGERILDACAAPGGKTGHILGPVYTGFPFGHVANKTTFPLGARAQLRGNSAGGYQITFSDYPTLNAAALNLRAGLLPPPEIIASAPAMPVSNGENAIDAEF